MLDLYPFYFFAQVRLHDRSATIFILLRAITVVGLSLRADYVLIYSIAPYPFRFLQWYMEKESVVHPKEVLDCIDIMLSSFCYYDIFR